MAFKKTNQIYTFEQKPSITLAFADRLNDSYDVVVDDIKECEYTETVADKIARALNPNVDKSSMTYGIAKTLAPKTALINKMRADIDEANRKLYQGLINQQEAIKQAQEAEKLAQLKKQETPKGDNKDVK
nr:MAG: hypothetical protein [Microvirus Sku218]